MSKTRKELIKNCGTCANYDRNDMSEVAGIPIARCEVHKHFVESVYSCDKFKSIRADQSGNLLRRLFNF